MPKSYAISSTGWLFDNVLPASWQSSPSRRVLLALWITCQTLSMTTHLKVLLRFSDKLLLPAPHMALALSAKAFSVSAPSVWNSVLSFDYRSAQLASSFRRSMLKTELFDTAYTLTSLCHHASPIRLRHIGAIEIKFD